MFQRFGLVITVALAVAASGLVTSPAWAVAPGNDDFANALVLSGSLPITVTGSNVDATPEAGEPEHAGQAGGASVWYAWTPTESGDVVIETCGSAINTLLAVYTGTTLDTLEVQADNNGGCGFQSRVAFNASADTTYRIAVDGINAEQGAIAVTVRLPPAAGTCVVSAGVVISGDTVTGTAGDDTIDCAPDTTFTITAGAGDDRITGGANVFGESGNDIITGAVGGTVDGGPGNDAFNDVNGQGDVIGGTGNDLMLNVLTVGGDIDLGPDDDGILNGLAIDGSIVLGSGNDGLANSLTINGSILGGPGDDPMLNAGAISNSPDVHVTIDGGPGNDHFLNPLSLNGSILGGTGDDLIVNAFTDQGSIQGGTGDDQIVNSFATSDFFDVPVSIDGGPGNDTITRSQAGQGGGFGGEGTLNGGPGHDTISGSDSDDTIRGGGGDDVLEGAGGSDVLQGEAGRDTLDGVTNEDPEAPDTLDGGTGKDNCLPSASDTLISCEQ